MSLLDRFTRFGNTVSPIPSDWYDENWTKRLPITVLDGVVSSRQYDFPKLLYSTIPSLIGSSINQFRFTAIDKTLLDYEIQSFNNTTGEIIAWIKQPSIENNLKYYMYYGNDSAVDNQTPSDVWTGYNSVNHLNTFLDSKRNVTVTNDGTTDITGKIGKAKSFTSDNSIKMSNYPWTDNSPIAISFWGKFTERIDASFVLEGASGNRLLFHYPFSDGNLYWDYGSIHGQGRINAYIGNRINQLDYITLTSTGNHSPEKQEIILNGIVLATKDTADAPAGINDNTFSLGPQFVGILDEFRVTTNIPSIDLINIQYNNQNDPESFYSIGAEETL